MTVACCVVDWGTTSFRLRAVNAAGEVTDTHRSSAGSFGLKEPAAFERTLREALADIGAPDGAPVLICGMAGSAQGWREAPYVDLPARVADIASAAVAAPITDRDVRILPGLAQRDPGAPDVMRGEEAILLGLEKEHGFEGIVCQPGTHSKWIEMRRGVVERFRTALTGELFAVLAEHTTLAAYAGGDMAPATASEDFADAVRASYAAPERLLTSLFSVRAGPLLLGETSIDARARLSGLLIGAELASVRPGETEVALVSASDLRAAYARAFDVIGVRYSVYDADEAVSAGLTAAAQRIWPERFSGGS